MAPKLSVTTTVAILAILYLVVADAATYGTIITTATTANEQPKNPCKSAKSCEEVINSLDFTSCELDILWAGFTRRPQYKFIPRNPRIGLGCCRELGQIDESQRQCRCAALQKILNKGKKICNCLDFGFMKLRAQNTFQYCRMPSICNFDAVSS